MRNQAEAGAARRRHRAGAHTSLLRAGIAHCRRRLLADGRELAIDALYLALTNPAQSVRSPSNSAARSTMVPLGPVVRTDAAKLTTVPGVHAAGRYARAAAGQRPGRRET